MRLGHLLRPLALRVLLREHDVLLTDLHVLGWTVTAGAVGIRDARVTPSLRLDYVATRSFNGRSVSFRREWQA